MDVNVMAEIHLMLHIILFAICFFMSFVFSLLVRIQMRVDVAFEGSDIIIFLVVSLLIFIPLELIYWILRSYFL